MSINFFFIHTSNNLPWFLQLWYTRAIENACGFARQFPVSSLPHSENRVWSRNSLVDPLWLFVGSVDGNQPCNVGYKASVFVLAQYPALYAAWHYALLTCHGISRLFFCRLHGECFPVRTQLFVPGLGGDSSAWAQKWGPWLRVCLSTRQQSVPSSTVLAL